MAYEHGVSGLELGTSITPPTSVSAGIPLVFGTTPVNLVSNPKVNEPVLCYTYAEAVKTMGYSSDFNDFTISEFISSHFALFNMAPVVFVNVLDPKIHKAKAEPITLQVNDGEAILNQEGALLSSIKVKSEDGSTTYAPEQYSLEFDDKGYVHIYISEGTSIKIEYERIDASLVAPADIIGGVSVDGTVKGLELVNQVFPRFRIVPGTIVAPKFSTNVTVSAVMAAKASLINGVFRSLALLDIPTDEVTDYTKVAQYKNDKNIVSTHQVACWPKGSLGGVQYHLSTQAAGVIAHTNSLNGDVPYVSPSNKNLQIDSAVLTDGTEIMLGNDQAAYLNGQGIVTALNWIGGWKLWGNRTAIYPGSTDPKDSFIALRNTINWVLNTVILTYWEKVDDPTDPKLIDNVVTSVNIWLNGLAASGVLLGGRVEFISEENPETSLADGKIKFHLYLGFKTPAKEIKFVAEYDTSYLSTLFAA